MDPETEPTHSALEPLNQAPDSMYPAFPTQDPEEPYRGLRWIFIGPPGPARRLVVILLIVVSLLARLGKVSSYVIAQVFIC